MPKLYRKRTILAKIESTVGTDSVPGSANAIKVRELTIEPIQSDEVTRDLVRGYLGNFETLLANTRVQITAECELAGSGTAGTAPRYGPLLKSCGFSETVASGTSVTYAPVSSAISSCSIYYNTDGILHKITNCRGTMSIACETGAIPTISFTMTGVYVTPTDAAIPSTSYGAQADPLLFKAGNTSAFQIHGHAGALQSWSLDMNNEINYRELVGGTKTVELLDRAPSGTLSIEAPTLATKDFFTIAAGATKGNNTFLHGTTAGNKVTVSCPQSDLGAVTYSDNDGVVMLEIPYTAVPNTGNDEVSIVYT
tara:strand:+ start:4005 stop:4934 length:930 start_codon:yes stop_codon:yes gene_type:complete